LFEGVEVQAYQRGQKNKEQDKSLDSFRGQANCRLLKKTYRHKLGFLAGQIAVLVVAFLLGRAVLLGELFPFGAAFVAAVLVLARNYTPGAILGVVVGLFTVTSGWTLGVYILSLVALVVGVIVLPMRAAGLRLLLGGTVFAVFVLTGTGYVAVTGPTTYEYVRVLFESLFAAFLAIAYYTAIKGLRQAALGNHLSLEELFCVILLLISVVAGAGQVQWSGISPGGVLAGLVVIISGYIGRAGLGAAAGAVMGVLPGFIFAVSPAALGAFAFAGFLGGLGRGLGRLGVVAGFLMGNTLLMVYLSSGQDVLGLLVECALAALTFLITPTVFLNKIQKYSPLLYPWVTTGYGPGDQKDKNVMERISAWGSVFEEVSCACDRLCDTDEPVQDRKSVV